MPFSSLIDPVVSLRILTLAFLAILFLQSGLDKVFNYKGNLEWLTGHFAKSPLASTVGVLLPVLTVLEVGSGALCAVGIFAMVFTGSTMLGMIGAQLCAVSIISLFFGQRVAQDYPGAATLAPYFLIAMSAIYLFSLEVPVAS